MPMDQVAELARQVANDDGVLRALQHDPTQIRKPLNLSEPQLRALISAGSFSTVRPVMTTSVPVNSLASQIATMDVESLFPPEGQGQFVPGELPPSPAAAPHSVPTAAPHSVPTAAPHSVPTAAPIAGVPPRSAAPSQSGGQAPHSGTPQSSHTPQAPTTTPGTGFTPAAPVTSSGTPQAGTSPPSDGGQTSSSGAGEDSGQQTGSTSDQYAPGQYASGQYAGQTLQAFPASSVGVPAAGCCGSSQIAMIAIVAQLSTTAQAGITAITAIAGLG